MADILTQVIAETQYYVRIDQGPHSVSPVLILILKIIQASITVRILQSAVSKNMNGIIENEFLGINIFQEPGEWFTFEIILELHPLFNAANLSVEEVGSVHVEQSLVVIHPDLHRPGRVDAVCVLVAGEGVGVEGAEDVTDSGARNSLQYTSTLPDPE